MKRRLHWIILGLVSVWPMSSLAHDGATGIVKERMVQMKNLGDATKKLARMSNGKDEFDPERVRALALKIGEQSGEKMTMLFPNGSLDHPTETLPAVWRDWALFQRYAAELEEGAKRLANMAGLTRNALKSAVRDLSISCRDCHDDFRKK